jgi:tetratricopeptide (TPR) repeat protein
MTGLDRTDSPQMETPMLEARRRLDDARAGAAAAPGDRAPLRDLSRALIGLGDALKRQGDLTGALAEFREGYAIVRTLAGQGDASPESLADLSAVLEKIGETLIAQGDVAGGLDHLRQGLDAQRRLSAIDPDMRRDVAKRVARVGELLILKSTLTSFRAGPQRESGPATTEWQRRASWSLKTAGGALADRGDLAGALAFHRECLDIRRGLVARDPADPAALLDLSYSLQAVADALAAQGEFTAALTQYGEALALRRALAERDPQNSGRRLDLAWTLTALAGAREQQGDRAGALAAYRDADAVLRAMSAGDADEPQRQGDLAVLAERIAALEQGREPSI